MSLLLCLGVKGRLNLGNLRNEFNKVESRQNQKDRRRRRNEREARVFAETHNKRIFAINPPKITVSAGSVLWSLKFRNQPTESSTFMLNITFKKPVPIKAVEKALKEAFGGIDET